MAVSGGAIAGWIGGISATTAATVVGAGVAIYGAVEGASARKDAKRAAESQAAAADRLQGEQKANAAGKAANERRAQIREERIKRARVMQAAENGGVADSSGESGALKSTLGTPDFMILPPSRKSI